MDRLKSITGTWQGTYSYDPIEHIPERNPVPFTMSLKQGWFGRFTGTVTDHGPCGMPGTGIIKGYFLFPRIKFTKRMPICYVVTSDGRGITLRDYLIEQQRHAYEGEMPHTPIFYQGVFSSPTRAQGTWIIRAGSVPLGDGGVFEIQEVRGSWSIEFKAA